MNRRSPAVRAALCALAVVAGSLVVGASGADAVVTAPPGGAFRAVKAARVLDTRYPTGSPRTPGNTKVDAVVTGGTTGVPTSGVAAVVVNVTAVAPAGSGNLTVYPAGAAKPSTPQLYYTANRIVPNLVTVAVGTGGKISVHVYQSATHVLVDVQGWYSTAATTTSTAGLYMPVTPKRLLDTRTGLGGTQIPAKGTLNLQVSGGTSPVPSTGAAAVAVNATVVSPTAAGYITVWPAGSTVPTASNLNYVPGQVVANRVMVGLSATGKISIYNGSTAPLHVLIDVGGWFTNSTVNATSGGYFNVVPSKRTYDSVSAPLGTTARRVQVTGISAVPTSTNVVAAALMTTVLNPAAAGNIRLYPDEPAVGTSDQNWAAGVTVTTHSLSKLSATGGVQVKNSNGSIRVLIDTLGYYVKLPPPPTFTTAAALPHGQEGVAYSKTFAATGGKTPYTFAFVSGSLAPGMTLTNATGAYTGTPTTEGTYPFTLRVTDAHGSSTTKAFSHVIDPPAPPPVTITTGATLPGATVGTPYTTTLAATGGVTPYMWTKDVAPLPTGLSLNSTTGVISGTPTTVQTKSFGITVTDSQAQPHQASRTFSITVVAATPPLNITTTTLAQATKHTAYSATLAATGGTAPYAWDLSAGALPAGLSLAPSTGAITGTPTVGGIFNFTGRVTDANAVVDTQALQLSVAEPPSPAVVTTALPGGRINTPYSATLSATDGTPGYTWTLVGGTLPTGITLAAATGVLSGTPTALASVTPTFRVTDSLGNFGEAILPFSITAGSDWAQPHYGMGRNGHAPQETTLTADNAPSLHEVWSTDEAANSTAVVGGVLYTTGTLPGEPGEVTLTAYDITTRAVLWQVRPNCGVGPVSVTASAALITCDGKLRAYSLTGQHALLWDTAVTDAGSGNHIEFAIMSDRAMVLESDKVIAYSLSTGARLWRQFFPEGASGSQIAVGDTTAVVAASDRLIAYNTANAAVRWTVLGSAYSVMVDNGAVYAAVTGELRKYALLTGGTPTWSTTTAGKVSGVLAGNGTVAIVLWREDSDFGPVTATHAYSESNGSFVWETFTPNRSMTAAIAGPLVWVTLAGYPVDGDNGGVQALNLSNGELVHQLDSGRRIFSSTAISDGRLVVARSSSLRVYGLDRPLPSVTTKVLRSGHVGTAYSDTLTATGGTAPYTWSVASGTLPTGVSMSSAGVLSGTPTVAGSPRLGMRVTDSLGAVSTRSLVVQISTPASGSWPTTGGNQARTGLAAGETVIGIDSTPLINQIWSSAALPVEEAGDLAVSGNFVYVSEWSSGDIRAYHRTSGATSGRTPVWTAHVDDPNQDWVRTGITVSGGRLLVGTLSSLYSFDATTGAKQWKAPYPFQNVSPAAPVVVGTRVVVGDADGYVRAFNIADGTVSWTTVAPDTFPGVPLSIDGLSTDGTRVYATSACTLYGITATTGAILWKKGITPTGARDICAFAYQSVPLVADGIVYAGSQSGTMAFNATTGDIVWARTSSSGGTMALSNGVLLVTNQDSSFRFIRAVDALTGALVWSSDVFSFPQPRIVVAGDLVLSPGDQGIYGLDIRTGDKVWTGTAASSNSYAYQPAVVDGVIYHVGADHVLRAYGIPT